MSAGGEPGSNGNVWAADLGSLSLRSFDVNIFFEPFLSENCRAFFSKDLFWREASSHMMWDCAIIIRSYSLWIMIVTTNLIQCSCLVGQCRHSTFRSVVMRTINFNTLGCNFIEHYLWLFTGGTNLLLTRRFPSTQLICQVLINTH